MDGRTATSTNLESVAKRCYVFCIALSRGPKHILRTDILSANEYNHDRNNDEHAHDHNDDGNYTMVIIRPMTMVTIRAMTISTSKLQHDKSIV